MCGLKQKVLPSSWLPSPLCPVSYYNILGAALALYQKMPEQTGPQKKRKKNVSTSIGSKSRPTSVMSDLGTYYLPFLHVSFSV